LENAQKNRELDPERKYLNMLHVWEDIVLSALERSNHINAFKSGLHNYYQFLDNHYKNLYKLDYVQKQVISKQLANLVELFPSGLIPAGTIIFELITDEGNELYDKVAILYFSEENEPIFLDDPYISKFYSNRLFSTQEILLMSPQLRVTESNKNNNEITLAIIKDSSFTPYPDDFIELFKLPNDTFNGLHDISVLLGKFPEEVLIFDLRKA
jgi:hypothetical protein